MGVILYVYLPGKARIALFLLVASCCFSDCRQESCPSSCVCQFSPADGLTADCSNHKLHAIPVLPPVVTHLSLARNNISQLEDSTLFSYTGLESLDLSNNALVKISRFSFQGLIHLTELKLHNNKLKLSNTLVFPSGVFEQLTALTSLTLYGNVQQGETKYRDDLFEEMPQLKKLQMDGLPGGIKFPKGFQKLTHLEYLSVSGPFDIIANDTFVNLFNTNLTTFIVKSLYCNCLHKIDQGAFRYLRKLRTLSLSENLSMHLNSVNNGWYGLQFTSIETLYLDRMGHDDYQVISEVFFKYLNLTDLKVLTLEDNTIVYINGAEISRHLPRLEYLSLANNRLVRLNDLMRGLINLQHLEILSIAFQQMFINGKKPHQEPKDDINTIQELRKPRCTDCVREGEFSHKTNHMIFPPNLKTFLAAASLTSSLQHLGKTVIFGKNGLQYFDYSHNDIEELVGPILVTSPYTGGSGLSFILSSNRIKYISPNLFDESVQVGLRITSVDLYDNHLASQLQRNPLGEGGITYLYLKSLNIGKNFIKDLPTNATSTFPSLEMLNLSSNALRALNLDFSYNPNLTFIDLSYNLLHFLDDMQLNSLEALQRFNGKNTPVHVYLQGNPLVCNCDTLKFLKWMKETSIRLVSYEQYECFFDGLGIITLEKFYQSSLKVLDKQCSSSAYVTVTATIFSVFVLVIIVGVLVYRFRWDVRFVLLRFVRQRKDHQALMEVNSDYKYDAFVAYHEDDRFWVIHRLLIELEGGYNLPSQQGRDPSKLRLCLHHRDFLPGTTIEENIIECISNSRKVLLILTNNFVTSSWCDFELQMARMKCFDKGQDLIVIVMLEPVEPRKMTKTLRALIRKVTYIEWPAQEGLQSRFWQNLNKALKIRDNAPIRCECGLYVPRNQPVEDN